MRRVRVMVAALAFVGLIGCRPAVPKARELYVRTDEGSLRLACERGHSIFKRHAQALASESFGQEADPWASGAGSPYERHPDTRMWVFMVEVENSIYWVTQPGHAAHPAVLTRSPYPGNHGVHWSLEGCAWGDRAAFEAWKEYAMRLQRRFDDDSEPSWLPPPPALPPTTP